MNHHLFAIGFAIAVSSLPILPAISQEGKTRLRTQFTGANKCLDVVNDGQNNQLTMAKCGNFSGQLWVITPLAAGGVRLHNLFTGANKCLDIVNDGQNNQLTMAKCGNFSGQQWSITENR